MPMSVLRFLMLCCAPILLSACASSLTADVTRFHQLTGAAGETVQVRPADPARAASPEFNRYADLVGAKLAAYGYKPPVAGSPSDLVAEIDWSVSESGDLRSGDDSPVSVGVGVGGGSGGRHSGVGVGVGVSTGFNVGGGSGVSYIRRLSLILIRQSDGARLFEGRAVSRGENSDMLAVMPYLVDALFKDFPGKSGETIKVKLPVNK
ncbi:MAG: DUF4136 domain-containing protein [Sphingomonadales bacterium]|nr:DUF4136 domain-containing protein [Sphingomonadales bacterium]